MPSYRSGIPRVASARLANGLSVLCLRVAAHGSASVSITFPVGARTDPPKKSGLAHFLEHVYALGSGSLGPREIDLLVERLGGSREALTTLDLTHHFSTVPAAALPALLAAEADRLAGPAFPPDLVADERAAVLEEGRQRLLRSPGGALAHRLLTTAFVRHPYRNPVVGMAGDVARLGVTDLRAFYDAHCGPGAAVVAVAGDIDPERAMDAVERAFGGVPPRPAGEAPPPEPEPPQDAPRHALVTHAAAPARRGVTLWKVPGVDDPGAAALLVAAAALADALPYARIAHWLLRDPCPFTVDVRGGTAATLHAAERRAARAVHRLATEPLDAPALARARRRAVGALMEPLARPETAARHLARFQLSSAAGVARLAALARQARAVTADAVLQAAASSLGAKGATVVRLAPPGADAPEAVSASFRG